MIIKYECAWCGKELRPPTQEEKGDDVVISPGICPACQEEARRELARYYMSSPQGGKK